jgi:hypothetical protein
MHRHLMTPPRDNEQPRPGLMAPDPQLVAEPVTLGTLLWGVAGVLGVIELCLSMLNW